MSLRLPFRVCRGLQPKSIGMPSKKKYVESVRRVCRKIKYLGDFLTKDVVTRELEPAKSAYAVEEFNRMPATVVFFARKAFHRVAL